MNKKIIPTIEQVERDFKLGVEGALVNGTWIWAHKDGTFEVLGLYYPTVRQAMRVALGEETE